MKNLVRASQFSKPNYLHNLLTTEFDNACPSYYDLFNEFLQHTTYNQSFCLRLITLARRSAGLSWDIRRLAVLMLEHQILKLPPDTIDEFDLLLTELNLKPARGVNVNLVSSVLKEGYSTTELRRFIPEFRRKLERLNRVHDRIKGRRSSEIALRDFINLSRRDCKLSLARYIFRPEEVVARILEQLQVAEGVKDMDTSQPSDVEHELRRVMNILPDFEAEILKKLCATSNIYWASEATSSEINSLVEYPLTTVVLVVKPPGSDMEFEIKRAGRKGPNQLNVVYARNGYTVPPSHRLDGASMLGLLRYEANAALRLANIYRLAHGTEAPMTSYLARTNIYAVPARNSAVSVLDYFTESRIFGQGFREMRAAMKESVAAFEHEGCSNLPGLPGALGLTAQFISQVMPAQSILTGSSSFRLDKLALYLSPQGSEKYFKEGLNLAYSKHEARQFADEILEEILGVYQPPDVEYRSYQQYLEAAFAVTENRSRADQTYLSLMQQIGKFWGTLLAVRGYSRGESFVARNVGLKSVWNDGQWSVRIIFMDHDALVIPDPQEKHFYVHGELPCMRKDERFIWGRSDPQQFAISEMGYLQKIYRIGDDLSAQAQARAHRGMKEGYRRTHDGLLTNPKLRQMFHKVFVERLADWDLFVSGYLQTRHNLSASAVWKRAMKKRMADNGYKRRSFDSFIELIQENLDFIETYSFLFNSDTSS
jgi:hypothetical protein